MILNGIIRFRGPAGNTCRTPFFCGRNGSEPRALS